MIDKIKDKYKSIPLPARQAILRLVSLFAILGALIFITVHVAGMPTPATISNYVSSYGIWALVALIPILFLFHMFFTPISIVAMACGLIFGEWMGLLWATLIMIIVPVCQLLTGRFMGGKQLNGHLPARIKRLDNLLEVDGYLPILYIRLFSIPSALLNYSAGTTSLTIRHMLIGSFFGAFPRTIVFVFLGGNLDDPANPIVVISAIVWIVALGFAFHRGRGMFGKIQIAFREPAEDDKDDNAAPTKA